MLVDIVTSAQRYHAWLARTLGPHFVAHDLAEKHRLMAKNPARFLRATFWRWCEQAPDWLTGLDTSVSGLAVGDIHVDNFGTWRDVEGRLVWGINDFDEAAEMPLALDLLRLAVSAMLFAKTEAAGEVVDALLAGYRIGLETPAPIVLDEAFDVLRRAVYVPDDQRADFWADLDTSTPATPPADIEAAILAAMPGPEIDVRFAPRSAGGGSLGRARWVGHGLWRGGRVVREAKALVPSGWHYAGHSAVRRPRLAEIAGGAYRSPDPWYRLAGDHLLVRRRSPNNRKIELKELDERFDFAAALSLMGRDLAAIHAGSTARAMAAVVRPVQFTQQLVATAELAATAVRTDHAVWQAHPHP
jgi:hypothetical protein